MLLVVLEHDRGAVADASYEALTAGRELAARLGLPLHAVVLGAGADALAAEAAAYGAVATHHVDHELLADYGPEAWGAAVTQLAQAAGAAVVLACGTDRGNEVLAHVAARLDLPMLANATGVASAPSPAEPWQVVRVRWGGSLLEACAFDAPVKLVTFAHHSVEAVPSASPAAVVVTPFVPTLDAALGRSIVQDRVVRTAGVTLATAPVVVGGGRGVGSPEGFSSLEELAGLLGGVVGCSRAVTNNGWRNHTDQVGQTGTRIAPDIYIACGISGAIQHWVGAMASKKILAINTDKEANMVAKADYAVIGDLHQVVPAISAEIKRRRG
jgi:electron transfer flavoprotein alpha subunit